MATQDAFVCVQKMDMSSVMDMGDTILCESHVYCQMIDLQTSRTCQWHP